MGAAKEAVERNETAPSELVKRLTALAEEQVLDAELDPEKVRIPLAALIFCTQLHLAILHLLIYLAPNHVDV